MLCFVPVSFSVSAIGLSNTNRAPLTLPQSILQCAASVDCGDVRGVILVYLAMTRESCLE